MTIASVSFSGDEPERPGPEGKQAHWRTTARMGISISNLAMRFSVGNTQKELLNHACHFGSMSLRGERSALEMS
jgi:hypothetical protein